MTDRSSTRFFVALMAFTIPASLTVGCIGRTPRDVDDDSAIDDDGIEDDCGQFGSAGPGTGAGGGLNAAPPPPEAAADVISEADIVEVVGTTIYALSQFGGLSIIDGSSPDDLRVAGQHPVAGEAFEMYVIDDVVYAMSTVGGVGGETTIEALDVSSPSAIVRTSFVDVPGEVSDSRIVGDILYVVSFEQSGALPTTHVTSMSLASPDALVEVDQESFVQDDPQDFGWKRSVYATTERLYVAGVEWDGVSNDGSSTIQVLDISDPTGQMQPGATVDPAGQIYSRWQMDEHDGVLRVVTQPGIFSDEDVPKVETFTVMSSDEITPLGYTEMVLPVPEALRAVRFDGDTAYVITAALSEPWDPNPEPPPPTTFFGDPLFVIDLTDPALPVQRGELEIPGWVYHMEVRGDRVVALGFDGNNPEGMINVSLFDVSDDDAPFMIERVSFGGMYSGLIEDQNRIHKSFAVMDQLGLIVVPFGDYEEIFISDGGGDCWGGGGGRLEYEHFGVLQLVDFDNDSLALRGSAKMWSQARRAFMHGDRLVGMADSELRVFDIQNRDQPSETSQVSLW